MDFSAETEAQQRIAMPSHNFFGENTQGLLNQIPFIIPHSEFGLNYSHIPRGCRGFKTREIALESFCYKKSPIQEIGLGKFG